MVDPTGGGYPMVDPTAEFFARLEKHEGNLLPVKARGSIRFDLRDDGAVRHWFVAIKRGNVLVSREEREADCVVTTDQALFDRFVVGDVQVLAAYNRNEVAVQGSLPLLLMFRRAFPSPPGTLDPRDRVRDRMARRAHSEHRSGGGESRP